MERPWPETKQGILARVRRVPALTGRSNAPGEVTSNFGHERQRTITKDHPATERNGP